jgi:hypothetical protein
MHNSVFIKLWLDVKRHVHNNTKSTAPKVPYIIVKIQINTKSTAKLSYI